MSDYMKLQISREFNLAVGQVGGGVGGGHRPPGSPSMLDTDSLTFDYETNIRVERVGGCASGGGKKSKSYCLTLSAVHNQTNIGIINKKKKP